MNKDQIFDLVKKSVLEYAESEDLDIQVKNATHLVGKDSPLDSLGLVNVIIDLETKLGERGFEVVLASEAAMYGNDSPFRSVATLVDYIAKAIGESDG